MQRAEFSLLKGKKYIYGNNVGAFNVNVFPFFKFSVFYVQTSLSILF